MGHNWRRVLLALLALVAVAQCAPLLGDCALLELLPTDLTDSISFVQPDGQAHFQGEFFVDFQRENHHNITFDLKFDTTFRFYVAPHEIDIDLWLYPIGGRNSIAHSALDVAGAPEVIFGHLPPGGYRLTMFFFGDPSQLSACPAVVVEMEMIPDPVYPQIDFTDLNEGYPFSFATTDLPSEQADVLNVQSTASKLRSTVTWATAYNFTVPRVSGRPVLWQVEASLGYQFLSGGSLGLLLVPNSNSSAPPDPRCYLDGKGCWLGSNLRMNEHVISELVRPGDYQLWLFDQVGEKDPNITLPCTPFSLTLSIRPTTEEEDLLNCAAPRVPTTLNGPDGLDALGYYTLTADMLLEIDPSTLPTEHRISLRPAADSLVRVEASESLFDVDVALYLADSDEPLAMSNRFAGYTDAVALDVAANTNYTIVLRFWGRYAPRFCETFPLAIAVAPVPSFDFCTAAVPSLPDLSALDAALAASEKLKREDYGPFVFDYAANYEARAVYRHNFTVVDVTNVKFVLGFNFLLGGLDIALRNRATDERLFGEQRGNVALLQGELHPGDYEVSVLLSPTQTLYRTNLTGVFPPCLRYTLGVAAVPSASAADDLCWQVLKTPTDLRELAYLGSAPYVHITDAFLVPDVGGKKSEDDDIAIKVAQASLLHVYTPARADLDIRLTLEDDAGKRVATSDNQYGEEEILVPLDAGERYTLTIRYYRPRQALPLCATYDLHLLVEPLPPGKPTPPAPGACSAAPLPADLFAGSGAPGWAVTRSASLLVAKDASAVVDVPLTLNQPTYLVAQLAFPFALTQISVSVLTDADATPIASSRPSVTGSALDVVLLPAGTFMLRLATLSAPAQGVAVCVPFTIVVASAPAASESLLSQPCTATSMPASLNAVPFFHPLGGYSLHFTRELLISDIIDETAFELTAESLVRVFTSGHPSVDVDVYLYSLTPHDPDSKVLAVSNGYGEELVVARLPRGSYTLVLRYAGGTDALILPDECIYFTLEMAAAPIADLLDNPDITQPCPAHAPAVTTLEANTSYSGLQWLVPLPSNVSLRFQQTFELRDVGYLAADLRYDFLIGGLSLTLARAGSPVHDAEINMNHAYLRTALPAGQYTLAVTSNTATLNTYGDLSFVRCSQFELDFLLNTTADPSFCDAVDVLPTDLFSANGGSQPYGGPQSPLDGSVQIYGDRFLAQRGVSEADVLFMAPRNVFARFFATAGAGSDLDFVLYSDAGKGQILAYSIGFEDFESSLFLLPAQPQPYLLAIKFWRLPRLTCPYYRFEAVIRDNATVADDLRCPAYLPPDDRQVPPSAVTLTAGSSLESSSSDYVLTKARLTQEARGSRWEHRISLNLPGNTTLVASVLFDFLTADFRLALSGPDTRLDGSPDYADDRASELNFENRLEADLPKAGVYTLLLRFQLVTSATQLADYCFNFAFSLSLASSAAPRPTVLAVDPPSGDNLQAAAGLTVRVAFSEQFAQVAATTDFTTVAALRTQGSGQLVRPSSAAPFNNRNGLRFVWSAAALADGAVYTLVLTPSLLSSTSAGVPFADYPFAHVYSFLSCDCNGHGTCTKDATGLLRCACTFPYAGEACQACADGYHGVGGRCEQDAQCTPALCGEHGRCDDSSGVPRCFCNDRYATLGDRYCSVCAPGYVNYPNCTARDEALEESTLCTAPLLPSTLDGLMAERDEVHLSGDFFLDADTKVHDVDFELRRDSVLRVYAEPHWIDVDLWLFPLHPDGSVGDDIAYSLRVYAEEELYIVLNGSAAAPPRYRLSFRYFIWNRKATPTDCETLNVELALKPLDTVQREVAAAARLCPAGADLLPMPLERRLPLLEVPTSGYSVHDSTVYALHAHDGVAPDAPDFFWNVTFSVAEVPNTEVLLTVQLDHQFLPGALALLLETGDARRHCGQFGASSARATCQPGRSAFNRNMLFTMLPPGTYTLWIYQPAPLLPAVAACAPFNFAFNISYVPTEDEDIFNCAAPRLPLSLNAPGMLSPRGFLHLAQEFLIEPDNAPVAFQLAAPSRIRVAASSALPIYFFLRSHDRANSSFVAFGLALHGSAQLAAALAPGAYSLHFWSWDSAINPADAAFCVPTLVQLALSPDGHQPATLCPPGVVASRLPDLTRTRVPTTLPPTRYYALRPARDTEASYNLRFESDTHVDVALTSDFVSAGVGVRLEYTASGRAMVVDGEYAFNQARLSGVFGRGNYTLRLLFPRSDTADVVCTPFDFSIELAPARAFVEPACDGEPLPLNLNELRYLGAAPVLDYFGVFRVPLVSDHSISFTNVTATGPGPSALHVFLDQPAAVMFQGALHRLDAAGARTPVAPLVSGLLRAQLEPNTTYQIELALARQLGDAGDATCVSVPIMWSVAPLALWPLPAECPQAARDHLPTIVPPPVGLFKQFQRWNYSSVALGEALYLQQAFDAPRSFSYTFDTDSLGRLYAAVGYDLRAGLLQVALTSASTGRMEGTLVRDQSVLVLENLAPGTYTLEVSEPRPERNVNRLTCLAFSLELIIERDASMLLEEVTANELPASLDTVAFLAYSPTVHFAVQALFTRPLLGVADPTIAFRLATRSAVRVLVQRSRDFAVRVLFDNAANPDEGAGAFLLGPGPHTLTLQRSLRWQVRDSADMWERDVQLGVEISIVPLAEADALYATGWVADVDSCAGRSVARVPSDVDPDAEGFYSFASTRLALSPAQQQRAATAPVHTVQFVLSEPSIVYAEVTYDPLYGDVAVRLVDSERILPPYFATVGQGRSVVHTVAPAEVYNLELYQPSPALGQPHCVPLSFRLVIHDAVDARGGLVCSDFNRLPFSLSTLDGGSLAYGGPMSQGAVSIYGDEFLYPPNSDSDSLRLDVAVTTLVSVYVAVERGAPLNTALYAPNATDPVAALFADAASSTHRQLYIIEPGRGRAKPFTLTIEFPWARPLIACPYYTFALVARPLSVVQSNLVCLRSVQPQAIPARVPLSYGFAEVQLTSSFAHRTDEVLPDLFVNFTLANASLLVTSLAFDSLVLSAELILQRADNPAQIWSRSVVRASAYRSQPFDMEVRLNVPLLEPAAYTLRIRRQVFPAVPFTAASLCLPFSWFFFVAPHQGAPYLLADPPGGVALRPETNLVLMLSFSAAPCNASGAPFNFATSHAFATLFSLVPQGGADVATLLPLWVQPSSESMTWRLVFNGLEANTTYVLRLADGALFDSLRREFRQPVSARYAVGQSGCSGHGALVVGECTCDEGYEGAYCEECADGFHEQGSDDQTVCVPDGEKCAVDSCGCQPPVAPCQPLGACDDSSGTVQCTCFSNRAGRRCDSCLPGYGPFPACPLIATSAPPCPCAHGSCAADGSCQCPPNWRGDLCNACAAGFEGDDCHASPATTATSSPATTATTSATTTATTSATTSATTTATSASSQPTTAPMSLTRITEIAAAVFVVIIAAGVAALCWVRRKQQAARRYADLPSESDTDVMLEERTVTVGNEKVAVKVNDDEDTFNPRSKNQDKMFEL